MNNYKIISEYTKQCIREYYQMIEKDLGKIINAPSTINKIIKYYKIAHDNQDNHYLIFNNEIIIRKYNNPTDWWWRQQRLKYWEATCLSIREPKALLFQHF